MEHPVYFVVIILDNALDLPSAPDTRQRIKGRLSEWILKN